MWPFSRSSPQEASADAHGQNLDGERSLVNDSSLPVGDKTNSYVPSSLWPFSRSSAQAVNNGPIERSPEYTESAPTSSYLSTVPQMAT